MNFFVPPLSYVHCNKLHVHAVCIVMFLHVVSHTAYWRRLYLKITRGGTRKFILTLDALFLLY